MPRAIARYREFAPSESLREYIAAYFSFTDPGRDDSPVRRAVTREVVFREGDSFCSPLFADGHVSVVFSFGAACHADGAWRSIPTGPRADVIGAMSTVGSTTLGERPEMIGVYFRAAQTHHFLPVATHELTDRIVALEELWGGAGSEIVTRLSEAKCESTRIGCLGSVLSQRIRAARVRRAAADLPGLTSYVLRRCGHVTVQSLAEAAGVSRQYLTRVFREYVGVSPKLYCRLARFQAGLTYAGRGKDVAWAQAALEMGYADQSHMIAEFRRFSSLTPEILARKQWFHPFIERARARRLG